MSIICPIVKSKASDNPPGVNHDAWYRQPILWLGAVITVAILGGCIATVVIAVRQPDARLDGPARGILGMPTDQPAAARSTTP